MAKSQWISGAVVSITTNADKYKPIGSANSSNQFVATESAANISCERALIYSKLRLRITVNSKTLSNSTVVFRNGGVDSALSVPITFGVTGTYTDIINTATVAAATECCAVFRYGATGTGSVTCSGMSIIADYTGTETITILQNGSTTALTTGTLYESIAGFGTNTATESQMQLKIPKAGYLKNPVVRISANTRSAASTFTLRKNSVDTAMVVTIPASTTGTFKDTTNFISIAANDLVCYKTIVSGTGAITPITCHIEYETSSNTFITTTEMTIAYSYTASVAATYYAYLGGTSVQALSESSSKIVFDITSSNYNANDMRVYILTNARAVISTVTLRKNGADTALAVSIPASTTGHFSNPTNSVSVAGSPDLNLQIYSPAAASGGLAVKRTVIAFSPDIPGSTALHHAMIAYL